MFLLWFHMIFLKTVVAAPLLSWSQCINMAQRQNADLSAALATRQARESLEGNASSSFLPQLSANLGRTRSNSTGVTTDNYSATLNASQNLFAGLGDLSQLRQAQFTTKASAANVQIVKARLSYDLKSAFENLRYAKSYAELTSQIIKRREANLRLVDLRFQSGRENKGSVLLSQAYLNQARYDDLQAQNARRVAAAQLARAIGLDDLQELDVTGEIPVVEPEGTRPDFRTLALETPEYRQTQAQEDAAASAVKASRAQFMPSLDLTGSVGRQSPDFFPDSNNRWSVAINLSFPFFTGGKDYYSMQSDIFLRSAATGQRLNASREVLAKLERAYASYTEAVLKFKVDQSFKDATATRAEIARERYNNGLLAFENWDIIESDLIARQKTYLFSWRDRVVAEAAWEQAQGKGVIP